MNNTDFFLPFPLLGSKMIRTGKKVTKDACSTQKCILRSVSLKINHQSLNSSLSCGQAALTSCFFPLMILLEDDSHGPATNPTCPEVLDRTFFEPQIMSLLS